MSLFLVDADAPGVTLNRLDTVGRHILGTYEVFLDDVFVPAHARVGAEGAGWKVLHASLTLERLFGLKVGDAIRNLDGAPLREVASTRALILAGALVASGLPLRRAVRSAIVEILSDDPDMIRALGELVDAFLPES